LGAAAGAGLGRGSNEQPCTTSPLPERFLSESRPTMRKYLLLPVLYVLFVAGSCEDEIRDPLDLETDYAYFPLELNTPLFYDQDSIVVFNTAGGIVYDTSTTEIRETLVEIFTETDGTDPRKRTVGRQRRLRREPGNHRRR